jgi:hypothetical protein
VRLEPGSDLEVGTQFELSIYGASGEEPLVLQARVLRDDGPQGFAVTFEDLAPETRQRIEQLVAGLPKIESLKGEEAVPGALVVATAAPADAADRGER